LFIRKAFLKFRELQKSACHDENCQWFLEAGPTFFGKKYFSFYLSKEQIELGRMTNINLTDISFLPFPPEMPNLFSRYLTNYVLHFLCQKYNSSFT
jgi:hypothetical protein